MACRALHGGIGPRRTRNGFASQRGNRGTAQGFHPACHYVSGVRNRGKIRIQEISCMGSFGARRRSESEIHNACSGIVSRKCRMDVCSCFAQRSSYCMRTGIERRDTLFPIVFRSKHGTYPRFVCYRGIVQGINIPLTRNLSIGEPLCLCII